MDTVGLFSGLVTNCDKHLSLFERLINPADGVEDEAQLATHLQRGLTDV